MLNVIYCCTSIAYTIRPIIHNLRFNWSNNHFINVYNARLIKAEHNGRGTFQRKQSEQERRRRTKTTCVGPAVGYTRKLIRLFQRLHFDAEHIKMQEALHIVFPEHKQTICSLKELNIFNRVDVRFFNIWITYELRKFYRKNFRYNFQMEMVRGFGRFLAYSDAYSEKPLWNRWYRSILAEQDRFNVFIRLFFICDECKDNLICWNLWDFFLKFQLHFLVEGYECNLYHWNDDKITIGEKSEAYLQYIL